MKEKTQLQKMKQSLKSAKELAEDRYERTEAWRKYAVDLEAKLTCAIERLTTISEGRYYPTESESTSSNKDQATAANGLKRIARMQERKP